MAPYVELEWGKEAYQLMWEIKKLFDPKNILNPGVILNEDKEINIKNLKPMPTASPLIDKCMECGLCEPQWYWLKLYLKIDCQSPSRELTLTPRQRIVIWREMERLKGQDSTRLNQMKEGFQYMGDKTCAADGMCATSCPVSSENVSPISNLVS